MSKENLMSKIRSLFGKSSQPDTDIVPKVEKNKVESRNMNANPNAPRQQHYYFAHVYLRERTEQNAQFLVEKLREESATKYLSFLWVSRGYDTKADEDLFIPADGLECIPVEIDDEHYGVIVQLPKPERMAEAYFVAIIVKNEDNSDFYRYFTLEFSKNRDGTNCTVLGEWNGGSHANYGNGGIPLIDNFVEALKRFFQNRGTVQGLSFD